MNSFSLSVADLRAGTNWGAHRARMITLRPYPLDFAMLPFGVQGGNATRIYRLSDLLMRCRQKPAFTERMEMKLVQRDQAKRTELQGTSI
jgi:hypothetical protein